ncbi:MAG: hypothetical protein IJU76_12625 [Desulfovibrionaceae bacterium]|nr:hypothetical protein [Desulfovibrionaceae bacterium]
MDEKRLPILIKGILEKIVAGEKQIYNPSLFYGESMAVSAVLDVFEAAYRASHPTEKICRIKSLVFVRTIINAVVKYDSLNADAFTKSFSDCDCLIIEDFEELARYTFCQEVFYGVFDAVFERGGQIVIGANCPPAKMFSIEPRVRTQLEGGIICDVNDK